MPKEPPPGGWPQRSKAIRRFKRNRPKRPKAPNGAGKVECTKIMRVPWSIVPEVERWAEAVRLAEEDDLFLARQARIEASAEPDFVCEECGAGIRPKLAEVGLAHRPACSKFGFRRERTR